VTFSDKFGKPYRTRIDLADISTVEEYQMSEYQPGGTTPLYDTMGETLTQLEKVATENDLVLVTIITDGYENSSREYDSEKINELIKISLDPDMGDMPNFNNNDIVIPTTGSELSKLTRVITKASEQYAISVVYLDMPTEVAVEKDEGRRKKEGRGVGRKLIEGMADGIKDTWDYLSKGGFEKEGMYKLLHFKWVPDGGWGHYEFEKEYVNKKLIKDYEL
jgi:hypothetical protein